MIVVSATPPPNVQPDVPASVNYRSAQQLPSGEYRLLFETPEQAVQAERQLAALGTHVPQSVRSEQFWLALLQADEALFDEAEALIEQSKQYRVAAKSPTISRDSETLAALQQALGVSDEFLDGLFQAAVQVGT